LTISATPKRTIARSARSRSARAEPNEEPAVKWSFIPELRFAAWGFALNILWEALQTPLYADRGGGVRYLISSRLHCAIGDVLILLGCYWVIALLWRNRRWSETRRLAPRVLFVALGVAYTIASELAHTRWLRSWGYAPEMPRILGVGLAPILQWLLIPSALLFLTSRAYVPSSDPKGASCEPMRSGDRK
jgi:hypothetical protein